MQNNIAIKVENANFSWGKELEEKKDEGNKKGDLDVRKKNKIAPAPTPAGALISQSNKNQKEKEKEKLIINEENKTLDISKTNENIDIDNNLNEQKNEEEIKLTLTDLNFTVQKGEMLAIIGEVGSGKSSILQAILNNMLVIDSENNIMNNNKEKKIEFENNQNKKIPKVIINGEISYVSQIPWIENETVRKNILFNNEIDEERYDKVLEIAQLKPDLDMLIGGDMTEIGEKGVNLSGGQKARVSIARGIYTEKDIYIFDDPISALDAHVGEKIMKEVILDYLKGKTRILVTHAIQYLKFVDRIMIINQGKIKWEGTYRSLLEQDFYEDIYMKVSEAKKEEKKDDSDIIVPLDFEDEIDEVLEKKLSGKILNNEHQEKEEEEIDSFTKNRKIESNNSNNIEKTNLIQDSKRRNSRKKNKKGEIKRITEEEDKEVGSVKWNVYFSYIKFMGGFCIFLLILMVVSIWQGSNICSNLYLSYWTEHQKKESNLDYYKIYSAISVFGCIFVSMRMILLYKGALRTSRILHNKMITSLVHAPINLYHDTTKKGVIINRISKDLAAIDGYTMYMFGSVIVYFFSFVGAIVVCSIMNIWCLIFLPFILIVGLSINRFYMNCSRDLARLDGIVRSPLINLLSATLPGVSTIRAFKLENIYENKFFEIVDEFSKVRFFANAASAWFGLTIDFLSVTFLFFLMTYLVLFRDNFTPQSAGLILTYYVVMQDNVFRFLIFSTYFENTMVSLERCMKFFTIPQEKARMLPNDVNLENWPQEGKIVFKDYSVKYRPDNEIVLKNLNFEIKAGEKVGVVGRTGSGKSTLCLCLFRILEPLTGTIFIDDVDLQNIGLKLLRSRITIIPQVSIRMIINLI
jgi:ABC-type multidrug transport system fused ATPase/permease subunit